tara:strand:+ start:64741 stop:65568 length:828 start_codon:yes stop_codon:yes gene_type:complete
MSNQGPVTKKILITLDLDMTLFDSRQKRVTWMGGSEKFWLDTFDTIETNAREQGVEVIFTVVTSKECFDDMCSVAATSLRKYLEKFNGMTYRTIKNKEHCLVWDNGSFNFESLQDNSTQYNLNKPNLKTPFIIKQFGNKTKIIEQLARQHNIPINQCIFLDDDWANIRPARNAGIHVVAYDWFYRLYPSKDKHIKQKLDDNKNILLRMVAHITHNIADKAGQLEAEAINRALMAPFHSLFLPSYRSQSRLLEYVPGIELVDKSQKAKVPFRRAKY